MLDLAVVVGPELLVDPSVEALAVVLVDPVGALRFCSACFAVLVVVLGSWVSLLFWVCCR